MSKIICDVCGTSYPETATQCPICGCVKPAVADNTQEFDEGENAGYTYVKGGRFSKSNVRKRVKANPVEQIDEYGPGDEIEEPRKGSEKPLVITAILLLIAIAVIVVFITLRFFGPWAESGEADIPEQIQTTTEETTTDGSCTKLEVSAYEIEIPEGGTYKLNVIKEPADTTDEVFYESKDPAIATVDENGEITPVSTGTTTIVITCGEQSIEVSVSCQVKEETPFMLDNLELKLEYLDQEWILYSGDVPLDEITFTSDDETVAVFVDGKVIAKGVGTTTVHAQYGDEKVSCFVTCQFDDESTGNEDGGVSEDGTTGEDGTTSEDDTTEEELIKTAPKATGTKGYVFKTQFGGTYGDSPKQDISQKAGFDLELRLVDAYGSRVKVTWKIYNTSICELDTTNGVKVKCKEKGTAYVVATTEDGETYVLSIRVN